MSGLISVKDHMVDLKKQIETRQVAIARSLPVGVMSQTRFEQAIVTLCGRNPDLLIKCSRVSLIGSVLRAAHLGLDVDPALGQAWIIPFRGEAQFIPGYKGLVQLAWRSDVLAKVGGEAVREGDEFDWQDGTDAYLRHKRTAPEEAKITHAWALFKTKGAGAEASFSVLPFDAIEKIRKAAPSAKARTSPWDTHYAEMAIKTALRRVLKRAPSNGERSLPMQRAMDLDERAELGLQQNNAEDLLDEQTPEQQQEEKPNV